MLNRMIVCLLIVFSMNGVVHAEMEYQLQGLDLSIPGTPAFTMNSVLPNEELIQIAAADNTAMTSSSVADGGNEKEEFRERAFTGAKTHKYLGIGSLGLALVAAVSPKEEDGIHEYSARGAALLGGAAVATGLTFHYEDLHMSRGLKDPDNLHALLGTLGALGFAMAVSKAPESGHAGLGAIGAISMGMGIKVTW